jgi:hypothetical protein
MSSTAITAFLCYAASFFYFGAAPSLVYDGHAGMVAGSRGIPAGMA